MTIDQLVLLMMAIGTVALVVEPLVRRARYQRPVEAGADESERLTLQKETLYTAIRDLEFDFQTGKVDQQDYHALRRQLEGEAVQVLRQIDAVGPLAALDEELERQILILRQQQSADGQGPAPGFCAGCGCALQGNERFCPRCGQPVKPSS